MTGKPIVPIKIVNHTQHSVGKLHNTAMPDRTTENGGAALLLSSLRMSYWEQKST